ncbi:biotin synthase BioB [Carboxylicivirga sp. RSCT41]|uniref:biotin synthase BioB n=1 Tax=Carboxylicivirga agarovorans TaxID=3417570 RepID=UPI003D329A6C
MIQEIKKRILNGGAVDHDEALQLMSLANKEDLYAAANEVRQQFMGNKMDTCSILNARSGRCSEDCKWCAQSAFHKTKVDEYELVDMKVAEQQAMENASQGVNKFSLVTSGRALSNRNLNELCGVYKKIGQQSDIQLCASMGLLKREQLEQLAEVGVKHYHCNIETAPSFFSQLCTTHTMEEKITTIKLAQELGMGVCSGGIIGMGETMEQRIEMAFTLRDLNILSIPINILMKVEGTKIGDVSPLTDEEVLTTFALFRLINPKANIRLAGGRQLIAHIQDRVLKAGVSAALVGDYLTTVGTNIAQDKEIFKNAGFSIDKGLSAKETCCKG